MTEKSSKPTIVVVDVLKGSIDDIKGVLGKASAADLTALLEAETAEEGEKRKGVKEAIEGEQTARTDLAQEQISQAVEAAEAAGMFLAVFTDPDAFEDPGLSAHLKTRVAELETEIAAKDEAEQTAAPKGKKPKKQRKLEVSDKAGFELAALAFIGTDGRTIAGLPDLPAAHRLLKRERDGRTFMGEVVFPEGEKKHSLSAVAALDVNGKTISICKMVAPFEIGGSVEATFAPGSLFFGNWPQQKAED